jgi:DNA-binding response OmpR family regulator
MVESLRRDDHQIVAVADGSQLLVQLTSHYRLQPDPDPIDLIITDIRMPIVNGLDIVQSLREASWSTPIVMVTAFADAETRIRASGLNAILLEKPFKMAALRVTVGGLLWLSCGASQAATTAETRAP